MGKKNVIDIIIPVYNGEHYLSQCIESILGQTYQDWSLLLVDDGSTDGSGKICDMYAEQDKRITVIHKENEGAAIARNYGIKHTQGNLISFIDCDDWLEPLMFETMIAALEKGVDIVICGFTEEYTDGKKEKHICHTKQVYDCEDTLKLFLKNKIGSYFWSMLFRRDVIQEPIFNLPCYEDYATIIKWVSHAKRIALLPDLLYHYRQVSNSSMHSDKPQLANYYLALVERHKFIRKNHLLVGWAGERKHYLLGCLKAAKDLARTQHFNAELKKILCNIRTDVQDYMPIKCHEIGIKYYIRLKLLLFNVDAFICALRLSSFVQIKKHRKKQMFNKN